MATFYSLSDGTEDSLERTSFDTPKSDQSDTDEPHYPVHPITLLQGPFEESITEFEAVSDAQNAVDPDPSARRRQLLDSPVYERTCSGKWKQRSGERYHPLWKLIAQLSFGIHLLAEGMALSESESLKILQGHVDEIDGFLARTTEDFDLSLQDMQERVNLLKIPLGNLKVLEHMLQDRIFRASIVEGNQKTEHVLQRSRLATTDSLKDVQKGLEGVNAVETYLYGLWASRHGRPPVFRAIYKAMVGNVEGWNQAFVHLQSRGEALAVAFSEVAALLSELELRVGLANKKHMPITPPSTKFPRSKSLHQMLMSDQRSFSPSPGTVVDKPLPKCPDPYELPDTQRPAELDATYSKNSSIDRSQSRTQLSQRTSPRHSRSLSDGLSLQKHRQEKIPFSPHLGSLRQGQYQDYRLPHTTTTQPSPADGDAERPLTAPGLFKDKPDANPSENNRSFCVELEADLVFPTQSKKMNQLLRDPGFHRNEFQRSQTPEPPLRSRKSTLSLSQNDSNARVLKRGTSIFSTLNRPLKVFRVKSSSSLSHPAKASVPTERAASTPSPVSFLHSRSPSAMSLKVSPGGSPRLHNHMQSPCSPVEEKQDEEAFVDAKRQSDCSFTALPSLGTPVLVQGPHSTDGPPRLPTPVTEDHEDMYNVEITPQANEKEPTPERDIVNIDPFPHDIVTAFSYGSSHDTLRSRPNSSRGSSQTPQESLKAPSIPPRSSKRSTQLLPRESEENTPKPRLGDEVDLSAPVKPSVEILRETLNVPVVEGDQERQTTRVTQIPVDMIPKAPQARALSTDFSALTIPSSAPVGNGKSAPLGSSFTVHTKFSPPRKKSSAWRFLIPSSKDSHHRRTGTTERKG